MTDTCNHYYVDRSGGFDWPKCVICGQAAPSTPPPAPTYEPHPPVTGTPTDQNPPPIDPPEDP